MAPEILYERAHGAEVDVWCLGILLYEMLHGNPPFQGRGFEKMKIELKEKPIQIKNGVDPDIQDLMTELLIFDAKKRIKMKDIVKHRAIQKNLELFKRKITKQDFQLLKDNYYMNSGGKQLVTHDSLYARQLKRESDYKDPNVNQKVFLKNHYQPSYIRNNGFLLNKNTQNLFKKNQTNEIISNQTKINENQAYIHNMTENSNNSKHQNINNVKVFGGDINKKLEQPKPTHLGHFQSKFVKYNKLKEFEVTKYIIPNKLQYQNNNQIVLNDRTYLKKSSSLVNISSNNITKNFNKKFQYNNNTKQNLFINNINNMNQHNAKNQIIIKNSTQENNNNFKKIFSYQNYSKVTNSGKPFNGVYKSKSKNILIDSNKIYKSNNIIRQKSSEANYITPSSNIKQPMSLAEMVKNRNKYVQLPNKNKDIPNLTKNNIINLEVCQNKFKENFK